MARICLGEVVAAHGIRGVVKVRSFTARPESLAAYGPLTDESGTRCFRLRLIRPAKGGVLAAIEGIAERTDAEALRGLRLFIERSALPAEAEGEYYHVDLIGLRAELVDGTLLGRVVAVHDFGAGDMIEVAPEGGSALIYPFTRDVVPQVEIAAGRLIVVPPGEIEAGPDTEERGLAGREER